MTKSIKNIPASVHQRLLNKAKEASRPFNELLQYFAIERFLYRLSKSPYADRFILKGALMFSAWCGPASRPTMDIDLLGKIDNRLDAITAAIKDTCLTDVVSDGISFNAETVEAVRITEDAEYEGVRIRVHGSLGNARISIQIDTGFGDVIVPNPDTVSYPALLDFPAPELKGYTMESTIAEKFQAMVKLGVLNSRMKDFYDIWILSRKFDFKGEILAEAVEKTFENRNTPVNLNAAIFDPSFGKDRDKNVQWQGFIKKTKLINVPESFEDVITDIKLFLEPLASSIDERHTFTNTWTAPGPWR
ncbi:MAG: nucleotidyl transferase AbiEii/AbiGii toxin family protein [Desulfobacteraceae bacterium]|nr:nucleotidyl transferase AbiEii/AbiGii toxin family protein [Desulfobacteraceae bacterium]MBC2750870.1 nucleotidyl transferase AbiEii/AbiGii toxin family protein [Desulfobacteraceae bacterium]